MEFCQEVFLGVQRRWPINLVLFANRLNFHLPVSSLRCGSHGSGLLCHAPLLERLESSLLPSFRDFSTGPSEDPPESGSSDYVIAPFWSQKVWFTDLLDLLLGVPVSFPLRRDLLKQPLFLRQHRNLHVLQLAAFGLSSEPIVIGFSAVLARQLTFCRRRPSSMYVQAIGYLSQVV